MLRLALHHERDSLTELEKRPAVQGNEFLPLDLKGHGHDRTLRPSRDLGASLSIAGDMSELRTLEDRHVKRRRLFGLVVESQTGRDLLHGLFLRNRINQVLFLSRTGQPEIDIANDLTP